MFKLLYIVVVIATLRLCASQLPQTGSFADASVTWGGKQFTGCTGQYAYEGQVKMLSPVCSKVGTANLAKIFEVQCNEPAVAINKKSKLVNSVITFQLYGQYAAVKVNATVGPVTVVDGKAAFSVNTATVCYVSGL